VTLADAISEVRSQALGWLTKVGITNKTTMDMAANYRARFLELIKNAKAEKEEKVRPHLDAQRAINAEYMPLIEAAESAASIVRDALSKYMAAEEAKVRAAAIETARVENAKRQAEYERQKAAAAKYDEETPPAPPEMVAPEPVKLQAGGQRGKKASLREVKKFALSDYAAALAHAKDHPDVIAAVEKVCFAQARAGATVPGVSTHVEQVAV